MGTTATLPNRATAERKKKADEHCHNLARPCMVPRVGPDGAVAWDDVNGWLFGA